MKLSHSKQTVFEICSTVILLLVAVCIFSTTFIGLVVSYTPFPMGDSWGMVMFMDKFAPKMSLYEYLLQEHNEHRILFTKSLLLFDYYVLGGQKLYLIAVLHLLNAAIFFLIFRFFRRENWDFILLGVLAAGFFSLVQFENFDSAFQLQFFFVNLFGVLSFLNFGRWIAHEKPISLMLTIMCAALAAFNMSNGLFVILSVLFIGLLYPKRLNLIALPLSCISIWFFYFFHYDSFPESGVNHLTLSFGIRLVEYTLMFIGNPFHLGSVAKTEVYISGAVGLMLGLWISVKLLFIRRDEQERAVFTVSAILFVLISIVAVAYGRLKTGGPEQALTGRYSSTAVLYWAIIVGSFWRSLSFDRKFGNYCFLVVALLGVGTIGFRQRSFFRQTHHMAQQRELIQASVLSNVKDMTLIRRAFAHYQWVTFERMKDQHMLPFRGGKYPEPGTGHKILTEGSRAGNCLRILSVQEREIANSDEIGYVLVGESTLRLGARQMAVINPDREIVGYATKLRHQGGLLPGYKWKDEKDYWVAFVGVPSQPIQLLSLVETNRNYTRSKAVFNQSESDLDLSMFTAIELDQGPDNSQINVTVEKTESFHTNGYYAGILEEKPFDVFGTWSQLGEMKYTGSLDFRIQLKNPKKRPSILLPFVLGPNRKGIEISVYSYDRNQTYNLSLDDLITHHWYFLDVTNALSGEGLSVEILDNSGEWGEWIAVGTPFVLSNPSGDSISVVIQKKEK